MTTTYIDDFNVLWQQCDEEPNIWNEPHISNLVCIAFFWKPIKWLVERIFTLEWRSLEMLENHRIKSEMRVKMCASHKHVRDKYNLNSEFIWS